MKWERGWTKYTHQFPSYMSTAGLDGQLKIWDIRTYKVVHEYYTPTPASYLDISDKGLLGVSFGSTVNVRMGILFDFFIS